MSVITEMAIEAIVKHSEKRNISLDESFKVISDSMMLTEDEKKDVADGLKDNKKTTKENPYPNSIYFTVPDEIDDATGMLMYQNVPWESKGATDEKNYIQFANNDTLSSAMKVLGRKYDFVDNDVKIVGTINFDNVSDYKKVLDFMLKQGMLVNFSDPSELDDIQIAEDDDQENNEGKSVVAKSKSKVEKADPIKFKSFRSSVVREKIK